jgi:hypothetical protein
MRRAQREDESVEMRNAECAMFLNIALCAVHRKLQTANRMQLCIKKYGNKCKTVQQLFFNFYLRTGIPVRSAATAEMSVLCYRIGIPTVTTIQISETQS